MYGDTKEGGGGGGQQQTSTTTAAATTTAAPSTTTVQEPPKTSTTEVQAPPPAAPPQASTATVIPPPQTSTSTTSLTSTTLQPPPTQAPPAQTTTAVARPPPPPPPVAETSTTAAKLSTTSLPSDAPASTSQTVPSPILAAPVASTSTSQAVAPPIIDIPSPSPSSQAQPSDTALRTTGTQTQTADSTAPTATDASLADATTQSSIQTAISSPSVNDGLATGNGRNAGNAAVVTTVGSSVLTVTPAASQTADADSNAAVTNTGPSTHATKAVVGGVLGGVAFVAIAVLIFWTGEWFRRPQKRPYTFSRDSIGPTPLTEKFRATFGQSLKNIRGRVKGLVVRSPSPSVNLDRGNSQFLDGSISVSDAGSGRDGSPPRKGGFLGLFSRSQGESGWRFGSRGKQDSEALFANTRGMKDTQRERTNSQPDFLALLNMDDKQLAAQANIKRKTLAGKQNRRSSSAGSAEHFLGGLGLSLGSTNPFLDSNAMPRNSAIPTPLSTSPAAADPFADGNAIRPPTQSKQVGPPSTYAEDVRRSRGQSVSGSRPPSSRPRTGGNMYRDSGDSVESFQTRRNKFRSDPFDLDRPELLSSSASAASSQNMPLMARAPSTPGKAHTRASSYSSRYSSGIDSMEDFGDPGPDIGSTRNNRYTPQPPHKKNGSSGQVSVGKAY
ncbi:hypothetical protein PG996_012762 [Apiospora saccharicola]|uniref:Uncharacterized protein n=1 Tax=Apiospora saccharicola TaxID=335842 RepID=A0ABR1U3J9_9PEZI